MECHRQRLGLWAGAALLAGTMLRLWFILHLPRIAGDTLIYGDIAKNLLLHRLYGFSEPGSIPGSTMLRPTLIRLPGYPLFLAACFRLFGMEHYRAVLYVQLAADLLTCWLCAALAGRLFGGRAILPILWLAALCPFTANYVAAPLTETLVLTTIALAFYGLLRWHDAGLGYSRWLWIIAAALGYSILLRPEQGLLAAAVIPAMLWMSLAIPVRRASLVRSVAPVLVASLCVLLPLVPWTVRNAHTFHVFQPLAPRSASDPGEQVLYGFNRWFRTWGIDFASTEDVYWNYNSDRIELTSVPTRAFAVGCWADARTPRSSQPLYLRTAALLDDYNQQTSSTPANDAGFDALARKRIEANPLCYYAGLPVARVLNMILRPRTEMMPVPSGWWKRTTPVRQTTFAATYAALSFIYLILAVSGLLKARRTTSPGTRVFLWAMVASILLRCALLLTLDNSEPRYTLEFFPILFAWAGGWFASRAHRTTGHEQHLNRTCPCI